MKITVNMLRNVCALFLTLRDQAEAEGLTRAAANADKAYRNYQELLYQADGKRPPGVGSGQPSISWKIIIKSRLPLTGGCGNEKSEIASGTSGPTHQPAEAAQCALRQTGGLRQVTP